MVAEFICLQLTFSSKHLYVHPHHPSVHKLQLPPLRICQTLQTNDLGNVQFLRCGHLSPNGIFQFFVHCAKNGVSLNCLGACAQRESLSITTCPCFCSEKMLTTKVLVRVDKKPCKSVSCIALWQTSCPAWCVCGLLVHLNLCTSFCGAFKPESTTLTQLLLFLQPCLKQCA